MLSTSTAAQAALWLTDLDAHMCARDYVGPDPYDALASPALKKLPWPLLRRVAIQGIKRSPIDLRPAARVPALRMAKTLGVIAGSLSLAPSLSRAADRGHAITDELAGLQHPDGGWGYEFDVQMRWGGYPQGQSNVVATAFVIEGLQLAGAQIPNRESVASFLAETLGRERFIAYAPTSQALIHNANMFGAATLQLLAPGHPLICRSVRTCIEAQAQDGTWPYGEDARTAWVDSFHTVYILYCLRLLRATHPRCDEAYHRGLDAWLRLGFDSDGAPKYFLKGGAHRADVHNIANALTMLATVAHTEPRAVPLLVSTMATLGELRRDDGTFSTRKRGPAYMRWESAHAHRALAQVSLLKGI